MNLWEREPDQLAKPSGCFDDIETAETDINTGGTSTRKEQVVGGLLEGKERPHSA